MKTEVISRGFSIIAFLIVILTMFEPRLTNVRAETETERLWVDAKINGKPVRLAFDTGTEGFVLFRKTAERLGLQVTNAPSDTRLTPGRVKVGLADPCDLTIWGKTISGSFFVFDLPEGLHEKIDGALGWQPLSKNIFLIDAEKLELRPLDKAPEESTGWPKFRMQTNSDSLIIETTERDGATTAVLVDTGSSYGISLHPRKWREWWATHTNQPATLAAYYRPGAGLVVSKEAWASQISIGSLALTDVPVQEADSAEVALGGPQFEASLGLAALKHLDFIVDGNEGVVYAKAKRTAAPPYEHNRLGAVFVPRDLESDPLVAHVVKGSPAYLSGVRDGDILLKLDSEDVTKWRADPDVMPGPFHDPPGTKVVLTVRRGDTEFQTTVVLKDILGRSESNQSRNPD